MSSELILNTCIVVGNLVFTQEMNAVYAAKSNEERCSIGGFLCIYDRAKHQVSSHIWPTVLRTRNKSLLTDELREPIEYRKSGLSPDGVALEIAIDKSVRKRSEEVSHPLRQTDGETKRILAVETGDRLVAKECVEGYGDLDVRCALDARAGGESVSAESVLRDSFDRARNDFQHAQQCHWRSAKHDTHDVEFNRRVPEGCGVAASSDRSGACRGRCD